MEKKAESMNYVWDKIWRSDPYNSPEERRARAERRLSEMAPFLAPRINLGDVLELGCGDGSFAACLAKSPNYRLISYAGLDLSPTAMARARSAVLDSRFRFELADISRTDLPPDSADTVFMLGVLEHLTDSSGLLRRVRRVLRPNGRLILTTSNTLSLMYVKRRLREMLKLWPYGYQRNYTPGQFSKLLAHDFVELAVLPIHGDWDFPLVAAVDRAAALIDRDFSRYILAIVQRKAN